MFNSNHNNIRDLKAAYESRAKPTIATASRSVEGDLTNMSTQQRSTRVASIAKSIDSVLETSTASPPVRPLATLRPSWIGPPPSERSSTPGLQAMKQTVTVEHSSPGLKPPVYIFTNLSDPQWEPVEMHCEMNGQGGHIFSKAFNVEEGEYQYKFRLGDGDWWTCDESKPTVDDGQGNKNNLLVVKSEPPPKVDAPNSKLDSLDSELRKAEAPKPTTKENNVASNGPQAASKVPEVVPLPNPALQPHSMMTPTIAKLSAPALLFDHEVCDSHKGSAAEQTPEREEPNPFEVDAEEPEDSQCMDYDHERTASPLFRQESVKPSSVEQEHAPLFRHESISLGNNHQQSPAHDVTPRKTSISSASSSPPIPVEADLHDHTLERFPIDHAGIIEKIRHTHTRLPEDETSDENELDSPTSQAISDSSISAPLLPIVNEADEEILEKIREAEEEEVEKEELTGEEIDPLKPMAPITPPMNPLEPEDAGFDAMIPAVDETIIEERIIIEIVEPRKSMIEVFTDRFGGPGNMLAVALGLLTVVAGICAMRFM